MRRFYVDRIEGPGLLLRLSAEETRHLARVLRLRPGDRVELAAYEGGRALAEVVSAEGEFASLRILEQKPAAVRTGAGLDLAQGLLKSGKMDDLVRSCTELGVGTFFPVAMARSVPRLSEKKAEEKRARWQKIAREAVKQSGREDEPGVGPLIDFSELAEMAAGYDLAVCFYEEKKGPLVLPRAGERPFRRVLAALGPEGGFTPEEAGALSEAGFVLAGLGPRILRAETACLAAAALLGFAYGDMGPAR